MAAEQFANDVQTTLSLGVDSVVTSLPVADASGFPLSAQYRIRVDDELMLVTGGAGTATWTVTRGIEGTAAAPHNLGADVVHVLTAGAIGAVSDPAAGVPGLRTLGTGATQAAVGTHGHVEGDITNLTTDLAARELLTNKSTNTALGASDTLYPSQKATKAYVDAHAVAAAVPASLLEVYVDYVNGLDANNGLSWQTAFKTIQAAYDYLVTASAAYGSDGNGRRGVGKIRLAPGDHQIGNGLTFDSRYAVEIIGTRQGRIVHQYPASASRIVSTSTTVTAFITISHATQIGLGFVFRDIAFQMDDTAVTGNIALTKVIYAKVVDYLVVERCSFSTLSAVANTTVTAVWHEDKGAGGDAAWARIVENNVSRMALYKADSTAGDHSANFNRSRIRDNVVFYGGTLPMVGLAATTNGLLVDGNNFEGTATAVEIGPFGVSTQCTFLNNSGEDSSGGTPPNPFYDVTGSCSTALFIGGTCATVAATSPGTWIRFNNAVAYNNMVIGPFDANGSLTQKRKVVDNSTANGNVLIHTNHRIAAKYKSGAAAAISDADFTTGPPPNGSIGVSYDTTASVASFFLRANGTWVRVSPGGLTTKGDLSTYSTAPTRLGVGTNGQILTADSTAATGIKWAAAPGGGSSPISVVVRTADSTHVNSGTTGTTLTSDSTLLWPIAGNSTEIWFFECFLLFNSANATMDIKLGWSITATGTTMTWGNGYTAGTTTIPGFHSLPPAGVLPAVYTAASTLALGSLTGQQLVGPSGFVFSGGTAGNVNLQWAQNSPDAADLYLVKGSAIRLTKLVT